jgi:large repetitive protein
MISHAFVDSSVRDCELVLANRGVYGKAVVLDSNKAYIAQIAQTAQALADVTALDRNCVVAHRSVGALPLENAVVTCANAVCDINYPDAIASANGSKGDIQPYDCVLVCATTGETAINNLARCTGEDISSFAFATGSTPFRQVARRHFNSITSSPTTAIPVTLRSPSIGLRLSFK